MARAKTNGIFPAVAIFAVLAAVLWASAARSLNVYDEFDHAEVIDSGLGAYDPVFVIENSFGGYANPEKATISRSSLYVAASYTFVFALKGIAQFETGALLNLLSALFVAGSAAFVFLCLRLFARERTALVASLVYPFVPYIFFNGVNASAWAMQLFTTSLWLFLVLRGYKKRDEKSMLWASVALVLNSLVYLSSTLLIFAHVYVSNKVLKGRARLTNYALLLPIIALVAYFTVVNTAYPLSPSPVKFVFSAALFVWEMVNGLTVPLFLLVSFALLGAMKKTADRKDFLSVFAALSFLPFLASFSIFHYAPIFNFNSVFPVLAVIAAVAAEKLGRGKLIIALVVLFILPKTAFLYGQFHDYEHPHAQYAVWLEQTLPPGSTVLVGHECPAVRYLTTLKIVCRGESDEALVGDYVTSQYFTNENQEEIRYAARLFGLSLPEITQALERKEQLAGLTPAAVATYGGTVRSMEDTYQFLFSVFPSPLSNAFFYSSFPKITYSVFVLE